METHDTQSTLGILRIVQDGNQVSLDDEVLSETVCCPTCQTPSSKFTTDIDDAKWTCPGECAFR